jgi:hypothetical protein
VDFVFAETLPDGSEKLHAGPDIQLESKHDGEAWKNVEGELRLRNGTGQLLHWTLVHFSSDYAVEVKTNEQIVAKDEYQTIVIPTKSGERGSSHAYFSPHNGREAVEPFKLILSTERLDDFLLGLGPLADTRDYGNVADIAEVPKTVRDDWFTKDMRVRIVPCADDAGINAVAATVTQAEPKLQA